MQIGGVGSISGVTGTSMGGGMTIKSIDPIEVPFVTGYGHNMTSIKGK